MEFSSAAAAAGMESIEAQLSTMANHTLVYEVADVSSVSGSYVGSNILVSKPGDQTSRWSSDSAQTPQFILLKLKNVSVVKSITFGKYEKAHVCNLKQFNVYGGLKRTNMKLLFSGGLKNDHIPETFSLKCKTKISADETLFVPTKFVKIEPLRAWGPTFNYSIWHVLLHGVDEARVVDRCLAEFTRFRTNEVKRMCMKFLRDSGHADLGRQLELESNTKLEHPRISQLYHSLTTGNFEEAESVLERSAEEHMFTEYIDNQCYEPRWTQLQTHNRPAPGKRGGHQMVYDSVNDRIHVFGGWDGERDLSDFWTYDITSDTWHCISDNTAVDGGPGPRSCHRMVYDSVSQQIFTLGRFIENAQPGDAMPSDFYAYAVNEQSWNLITEDTATVCGPSLIYDHQMAIDEFGRTIYVFGGRLMSYVHNTQDVRGLLAAARAQHNLDPYSGLYSYHIPTNTWTKLRSDCDLATQLDVCITGRCAHSMVFCEKSRKLYMFAGQRGKDVLNDFLVYEVDTDLLYKLTDENGLPVIVPQVGNNQRANIDCEQGEIHVLSGTVRLSNKQGAEVGKEWHHPDPHGSGRSSTRTSVWVYHIAKDHWQCCGATYREHPAGRLNIDQCPYTMDDDHNNTTAGGTAPNSTNVFNRADLLRAITARRDAIKQQARLAAQPCPRHAHQLVYCERRKTHYLFGGNPGQQQIRLDDFWKLEMHRYTLDELLFECRWQIRQAQFLVLLENGRYVDALAYLRQKLAPIAQTTYASEQLHELTLKLVESSKTESRDESMSAPGEGKPAADHEHAVVHQIGAQLYELIVPYFPWRARPPAVDLTDMVEF